LRVSDEIELNPFTSTPSPPGGTALSADQSPPQAPGSPDQPADQGWTADGDRPRPFFADPQPESDPANGTADHRPAADHPAPPPVAGPRYGDPVPHGPQYGQPPPQPPGPGDQPGRGPGRQPAGWPQPNQPPRVRQRANVPERELRQRAIAALVFGGVSLIALFGLSADLRKGVYVLSFSALIGLAACVIGISALVKARKTNSYRPRGAIGGIVLGVIGMLISVPILLTYLAFPTQLTNYVNCLSQAQNSTAQKACMTQFYKSIGLDTSALKNP